MAPQPLQSFLGEACLWSAAREGSGAPRVGDDVGRGFSPARGGLDDVCQWRPAPPGRMLELGFLRRQPVVSELKNDLASLRLNEAPEKSRKGLWIFLGIILLAAGAGVYAWRSTGGFSKVEVATVTPTVEQVGSAAAGTPVLTASGYLVARREAVVSSKIQGRLLELRVEEGSEVQDRRDPRQARERRLRGPARARPCAAQAGGGRHRLVGRRHPARRGRPGRGASDS